MHLKEQVANRVHPDPLPCSVASDQDQVCLSK